MNEEIKIKVRERLKEDCQDNCMGLSDRYFSELIDFILEESMKVDFTKNISLSERTKDALQKQ